MEYEVFAVSEEGTETVAWTEDRSTALDIQQKCMQELQEGRWVDITSLNNVVRSFNVDTGPTSETISEGIPIPERSPT